MVSTFKFPKLAMNGVRDIQERTNKTSSGQILNCQLNGHVFWVAKTLKLKKCFSLSNGFVEVLN